MRPAESLLSRHEDAGRCRDSGADGVADAVEVEGNYSSQAGCLADGPHVELIQNDHLYTHFDCRFGPDGFWHVWLSN